MRRFLCTLTIALAVAQPVLGCPRCGLGRSETDLAGGSLANGYAIAGCLLLAAPVSLLGIFALLLGQTLRSTGSGLVLVDAPSKGTQ
jgi:hypothetical protein